VDAEVQFRELSFPPGRVQVVLKLRSGERRSPVLDIPARGVATMTWILF
jgi:hypothetical protein